MSEPLASVPAITASALMVDGPAGPIYGPVDLVVDKGGVTVLVCPPGVARTALLLTLAGRMRHTSGGLRVFDRTGARSIFGIAALAAVDGVDDIAQAATVGELVTETMRWNAAWYRAIRRADDAAVARVCGPVFGDLPIPATTAPVEELGELDTMLLRISLANVAQPPLLVVGGVDGVADDRSRSLLVERLAALGTDQTVVTAGVNGVAGHAVCQIVVDNVSRPQRADHPKGVAR